MTSTFAFLTRRIALAALLATATIAAPSGAAAQDFPVKPVIFVATGTIGGGADVQARLAAAAIEKSGLLNEPVAVINRGSGGSQEGYAFVRSKTGDAHYALTVANLFLTYPMVGQAGFTWTDFTPVANLVFDPVIVVVPAASDIKTLDDLLKAAKEKPNQITIGGAQIGTQDHMGFLTFQKETGIELRYVPFAGGGEVHRNILGGQINVAIGNPSDYMQSIEAGLLRPIVMLDDERNPAPVLADVPTAKELGIDASFVVWRGWVAPGGISDENRDKLVELFKKVIEDESFKKDYMLRFGMRPAFVSGEEFRAFLAEREEQYRGLLKEAGIL